MNYSNCLEALNCAARGEWERAHRLVQDDTSTFAKWIHANLHREEGDDGNAAYWYRLAGREPSNESVADERERIRAALQS